MYWKICQYNEYFSLTELTELITICLEVLYFSYTQAIAAFVSYSATVKPRCTNDCLIKIDLQSDLHNKDTSKLEKWMLVPVQFPASSMSIFCYTWVTLTFVVLTLPAKTGLGCLCRLINSS